MRRFPTATGNARLVSRSFSIKDRPWPPSSSPSAELDAARAAARNTDSGGTTTPATRRGQGDPPARRRCNPDARERHAGQPEQARGVRRSERADAARRRRVSPPSRLPTGGTRCPNRTSPQDRHRGRWKRVNAIIEPITSGDSGGQVLTTNQGVAIADNQNSLEAGARGPRC